MGVVLAVTALVVALAGLIAAVGGVLALFRKVAEVHVLVNSQLAAVVARVTQLTGVLQAHDVAVPRENGSEQAEKLQP
jgi:nucleoside permease NupC